MQTVNVQWQWIRWNHGDNWKDDIAPQLAEYGLTEKDLKTCVYVIGIYGKFAIDYPKKESPTLYIGSGNFKARLAQHERWLSEITELVHDYSFYIAVCTPEVNERPIHKEMEAALIQRFKEMYGCIAIRNKRHEYSQENFEYLPQSEFKKPLMLGRGYRYHWAIRPMKSNRYYKSFCARI